MKNYEILVNHQSYAVVGLNPDPEKFAHKIATLLKEKQKDVIGVNQNYDSIEGFEHVASINDVNVPIDVVVMVVNPTVGMSMIEAIANSTAKYLWLQPGTRSDELISIAESLGLIVIEDCVLASYAKHE